MPIKLGCRLVGGKKFYYRPGSSDELVLREVVEKQCYRKLSVGFEVLPGEKWLDLGANIGAFASYCRLRGASAVCYEPEAQCFKLLSANASDMVLNNSAVTHYDTPTVEFDLSPGRNNSYARGRVRIGRHNTIVVPNTRIDLIQGPFDGVKMDIEGSEMGILDTGLIPKVGKLCLEYHSKRHPSTKDLARRLGILKDIYQIVSYPPELDRLVAAGGDKTPFLDRLIFCKNLK